jgi:galactonate dehydratase
MRDSVLGYANGWYRTERTPEAFLEAARAVIDKGFKALKLDPFGTAQGFIDEAELALAEEILATLRRELPADTRILIDVHARFTEVEAIRLAKRLAPIGLYWWEEPTTRDRQETVHAVAAASPIPVATGEMYDTVGQFFTLAEGGGVNIFQPEPMSLGGIANTLAVADVALAHGSYIAPHQSGGPVATAVCLQLAACVPNFLIQEHFDAFNEPWTRDLVTWHPAIDPENGHLSLPEAPGLGIDLNVEVARAHPYDAAAYLNIFETGWERRLGTGRDTGTSTG